MEAFALTEMLGEVKESCRDPGTAGLLQGRGVDRGSSAGISALELSAGTAGGLI